jgi:hypothetical protein
MKKLNTIAFILVILTFTFVVFILIGGVFYGFHTLFTTRDIYAQVEEMREGIVLVNDSTGNLWEFESDEFVVNDIVKIRFDTNQTELIYDDIIINVWGVG